MVTHYTGGSGHSWQVVASVGSRWTQVAPRGCRPPVLCSWPADGRFLLLAGRGAAESPGAAGVRARGGVAARQAGGPCARSEGSLGTPQPRLCQAHHERLQSPRVPGVQHRPDEVICFGAREGKGWGQAAAPGCVSAAPRLAPVMGSAACLAVPARVGAGTAPTLLASRRWEGPWRSHQSLGQPGGLCEAAQWWGQPDQHHELERSKGRPSSMTTLMNPGH